jgi:hypothetical protein
MNGVLILSFCNYLWHLKVSKKIENPASFEVPAVIRFLNEQNVFQIEIYRQLIAAYREGLMDESDVRKQCRIFNEGRS